MTVKANKKVELLSKTNSWTHVQIGKTKGDLSMRSVMPYVRFSTEGPDVP